MKRTILAGMLIFFGIPLAISGCTRAAIICEIICNCEHCNDQAKIEACNQLGTAEEVATAYACNDRWEAYTVCVEQRGTCDEKNSRFTTRNDADEDRCQDEIDALDDCINKASAHDGTSGSVN